MFAMEKTLTIHHSLTKIQPPSGSEKQPTPHKKKEGKKDPDHSSFSNTQQLLPFYGYHGNNTVSIALLFVYNFVLGN